jgi:amino acid transporter
MRAGKRSQVSQSSDLWLPLRGADIGDPDGGSWRAGNLAPLLPANAPVWWQGAAGIFANCAFLLCGFQAISQVVEERSERLSFQTIFRILILSIAAATGFYCLVVIATSSMISWPRLPANSLAFVEAPAASLRTGVGAACPADGDVFFGEDLEWRLPDGRQNHDRAGPEWIAARLDEQWHGRSGVPAPVVLAIFSMNVAGLSLGRGAVGLLVDTITISLVFGYAICCIALPVLRRREQATPPGTVTVPGIVLAAGVIGSVIMACVAIAMPPILAGGFSAGVSHISGLGPDWRGRLRLCPRLSAPI